MLLLIRVINTPGFGFIFGWICGLFKELLLLSSTTFSTFFFFFFKFSFSLSGKAIMWSALFSNL